MTTPPTTPAGGQQVADSIPAGLRRDLVHRDQRYLGRDFVVFKNPLGLTYYRLPKAHAAAAFLFDGKRSVGSLVDELRASNRYWRALPREKAQEEVMQLARQLAMAGLLRVAGGSAVARGRHKKQLKKKHGFELTVGKALYFRKSLFDPDVLLSRMVPWFRWLYTPAAMMACGVFFVITLFAVLREWDEVTARAANFFTFENLALSWVIFFGVKIIHEFGHGLTCKRFGGEVHEMGFMFILFTPYLYCNVSDSWLASKAGRIYVTAAGIFVELILACIAAWLWLGSQPGLFHQVCFNTMFLCSISTVIFNANPLLKFDGYYIMTDLLEIPNLKQKSNAYVTQWAQRALLGIRKAGAQLATYELNPLFGFYAVASYIYGWVILYSISTHLFNALQPYGLEVISRSYVALFLFTSLALPLYRLSMSVKDAPEIRTNTLPRMRYALFVILAASGLLFVIPWNDTIKRMIVIEHAQVDPFSSKSPGFLKELNVREGQSVAAGELVARLENRELLAERKDLEAERELAEIRYRAAITDERPDVQQAASAQRKMAREIEEQIAAIDEKIASLEIRAPRAGVVRTWHIRDLVGQYFPAGRPVVELGTDQNLRGIIPLDERQARRVQAGQTVRFRILAEGDREFSGVVSSRPVSPIPEFTSPVMANLLGGDVPSTHDAGGRTTKPSLPHYEADVAFDPGDAVLRPGMAGKARITIARTTLGLWLWDRFVDWLNPDIRL